MSHGRLPRLEDPCDFCLNSCAAPLNSLAIFRHTYAVWRKDRIPGVDGAPIRQHELHDVHAIVGRQPRRVTHLCWMPVSAMIDELG